MDRDNFTETLRALKNQKPYRAFIVHHMDGERMEVDFPDALSVRDGVAIDLAPGTIPHFFDHESVSKIIGEIAAKSN
jgi:hypothetical protein